MPTRDYFAELYVAGFMGDDGWSIYFPKRDVGFDFIATKAVGGSIIIRPVQVKGLYPSETKTDRVGYGYIGKLTQLHQDMALVLPYFSTDQRGASPDCIAFMPRSQIKRQASRGYKCLPAKFSSGKAVPRASFMRYFGFGGMRHMETQKWSVGG